MGSIGKRIGDDPASYFTGLARHYRSLAYTEPHAMQSGLFAAIAADYAELAGQAIETVRPMAVPAPSRFVRWLSRTGRDRRTDDQLAHPLSLPPAASGAKSPRH